MKIKAAILTVICFTLYVMPVYAIDFNYAFAPETIAALPQYAYEYGDKTLEQKTAEDRAKENEANYGSSSGDSESGNSGSTSATPCYEDCIDETTGLLIIGGILLVGIGGLLLLLGALKGNDITASQSAIGLSF